MTYRLGPLLVVVHPASLVAVSGRSVFSMTMYEGVGRVSLDLILVLLIGNHPALTRLERDSSGLMTFSGRPVRIRANMMRAATHH